MTLAGDLHGLTALRNAYHLEQHSNTTTTDENAKDELTTTTTTRMIPGPLIFSQPTLFGGALWIPHIRQHAIVQSILSSPEAQTAKAILCHADITGASMNDLLISTGGVPPKWFPEGIPVYSGHFHKPHVVPQWNRCIEYIGSPYQVSLSEAQQEKALVVLNQDWQIVERIPLRIGRFHFRPTTAVDFLALRPATNRTVKEEEDDTTTVCAGDRVVWSPGNNEWYDEHATAAHTQMLRQAGIDVELRQASTNKYRSNSPGSTPMDAKELEDLSPASTWEAFLRNEVSRGSLNETRAKELEVSGLEIIEAVQRNHTTENGRREESITGTHIEFQSMTLEGFGPFSAKIEYPLNGRGLVLVRGTNEDDGSDSNGSGKSSLAMAPLWALTGALDPRPLPDGKVADVIHDNSKIARVTLRGTRNGKEFVIMRSKTSSKGGLSFSFDGEDQTAQTAKETQLQIDETLGISSTILSRSVFFGQHPLNDLLDASDTRFKEELALLVPLAIWEEVLGVVRIRARNTEKRIAEIDGMISIRQGDLVQITDRLQKANNTYERAQQDFEEMKEKLEKSAPANNDEVDRSSDWISTIEKEMEVVSQSIEKLERQRCAFVEDMKSAEERLVPEVERAKKEFQVASQVLTNAQRAFDVAEVKLQSAVNTVEKMERDYQLDLAIGLVDSQLQITSKCPTCGQALSDESHSHAHKTIQKSIENALKNKENMERERDAAREALHLAESNHAKKTVSLTNTEDTRSETLAWVDKQIQKIDTDIRSSWIEKERLTKELAAATRKQQDWIEADSVRQKLNSGRDAVYRLQVARDAVIEEQERCRNMLDALQCEQQEEKKNLSLMKDMSAAFGKRGVQVFVLRNALEALKFASQSYLDELSDSTLDLRLHLDDGDRILRLAGVSFGAGKSERSLASLSGGQWRRCSLALQLGFADLLARRGAFSSSLLVFDEPLTHLDQSGRASFGKVLRRLLRQDRSTILLILQDLAAEELTEVFDAVDTVIKSQGESCVVVHPAEKQ